MRIKLVFGTTEIEVEDDSYDIAKETLADIISCLGTPYSAISDALRKS